VQPGPFWNPKDSQAISHRLVNSDHRDDDFSVTLPITAACLGRKLALENEVAFPLVLLLTRQWESGVGTGVTYGRLFLPLGKQLVSLPRSCPR
jgi:hypothetical protein